ncbi:ABC transporter [Theileria orientalis strain Shintoku]|uniref:ABC transporter n=1 Tax=Theileria orientalis strain Shintoku TaxID=869250 RepID=J4C2R5_THEOR|nr:ABC transporter [Theileria orientalis strain Shintoku]BAM39151.1 ABC transporter [Theileria orientalis strain Shintoku]|eukprot:XP_009689452.1 ABC transporter [Theileria orientalis strain Shintoku]
MDQSFGEEVEFEKEQQHLEYVEPYKYHPLPVSDQILIWEPIFSKHVSDGLVRLDSYHYAKSQSTDAKAKKPYKSILLRALFLTIWKRVMFLILGLIAVNLMTMSIAILVKKLLGILNKKSFNFINTALLLSSIVVFQIIDGLFIENINFYMFRLITISHYLFAINVFNHGLCYRRSYFNNIDGTNTLGVCNQVLHSSSPDSDCSKNPLFCQALRYQNKDINTQMYSFVNIDSYNVSFVFLTIKQIIEFLSNFSYGVYLLSLQVKVNIWLLYFVGIFFFFLMIVVEIINVFVFRFILYLKDHRLSKSNDIFLSLSLIKKMFYDDIAINIITQSRNNELYMVFFEMFLTVFDLALLIICINGSFYIIKQYFVESVKEAAVVTDIDTAGFMATFYIFLRIINSMVLIPFSIKLFGKAYASFKRLDEFIKDCSPNFYICDNKFSGSTSVRSIISDTTTKVPNDVVVYYKDATFTWVHTRDDLLNKKYEIYLKNINFELKRGEMAIVTGSQGSGKSNFVRSIVGEMTMVGGSMAIVPLHTSMPIFYASQDIFLQQGTIRSNIAFGYKFDEQLYKSVLKAVELEYDISTWEKGDLRVVSDNAPSLSGGQRVRMELARAIYAYLVFHKVNKEYNNSQCSFLMCLDASFHGLDPYVSKTIFNNLFNVKTGLLVKNDLSVVLTTSKQTLEICSKMLDQNHIPNPPIYKIKNQTLQFHSNLHDFVNNNNVDTEDYMYLSARSSGPYNMSYLSNDMLRLCSSDATTRLGRMEMTRSKYSKSFKSYAKDELAGSKYNPYFVYIKPAIPLFVLYMILTVVMTIMDNVKLVLSTNLSDYITKNINQHKDGQFVDLSEIKTRSNLSFKITIIFVSVIIVLSIFSAIFFALTCFTSSRKIHEYSINSLFKNSSSVLKIKKEINHLMTYFSCDIVIFDSSIVMFLSGFLYLLIQLLVNIVTLLCLIPISMPFVILSLALSFKYILLKITNSSKNSQLAYFESTSHLNYPCENAISGSPIYRSFNKQPELIVNFTEDRDYNARCKFFSRFALVWSTLTFDWVFSLTTLLILIALITLDRFTKFKLKVGYFGLALSFSMSIIKLYSRFSILYTSLEMFICSVHRFRYFIPPGHKLKFDKCLNIHEEYVVNPANKDVREPDKKQLLRRRAIEFKADSKKFFCLKRLFYRPKLTIVDVGHYLTAEHSGVELKDVCVYTTSIHNIEGMILKHVSVSAHKSEIIGMVGRTGAGKTTLLSVLQNISTNRTGQVLLDGKDLNDIPKVVLRQIVGVLPQLPFVFKGWTVRRFLDPRKLFTDDDIKYALNQCGLLNFVFELQGGKKLDTVLVQEDVSSCYQQYKNKAYENRKSGKISKTGFETDMLLSNSQLRTLWLARLVLYRHFYRMIVVDEPPEEDLLDENSAKDDIGVPIYDLLEKYFSHCTTFVTAHDVNTLKSCTSVWIIHDGSLVRTCKTSDIAVNESIASIIEESVKYSH